MKRTKEMTEQICYGLGQGLSVKAVCGMVGISTTTYYNWKHDSDEFRQAVDATQCKVEVLALEAMKIHGERDWRVWAWILERRFPKSWGPKREIEVHHEQRQTGEGVVADMLRQVIERDKRRDKDVL